MCFAYIELPIPGCSNYEICNVLLGYCIEKGSVTVEVCGLASGFEEARVCQVLVLVFSHVMMHLMKVTDYYYSTVLIIITLLYRIRFNNNCMSMPK